MSIKVDLDRLNAMSAQVENISRNVSYVASEVNRLKWNASEIDVVWKIVQISGEIEAVNHKLNNLSASLLNAASIYTATERKIVNSWDKEKTNHTKAQNPDFKAVATGVQWIKDINDDLNEDLNDMLKNVAKGFGDVGTLAVFGASTVGQIIKTGHLSFSESGTDEFFDFLKDGNDVLKKILPGEKPDVGEVKNIWQELIGLDDVFKGEASTAVKWGDRFKENFGERIDDWGDDLTHGGKAVAEWAGIALTVVASGFDNYEEMQDEGISVNRAIAETAMESAIDIGKDVVIGAAVSAAIGATCTAGAPVIAVTAITAGIGFSLDAGAKALTGKDLTELLSDTVLDLTVDIGKQVGDAVSCKNPLPSSKHPCVGGVSRDGAI